MFLIDQGLFWAAVGREPVSLCLMELFAEDQYRVMLGDTRVCVLRFCPATELPSENFQVSGSHS